MTLRSTRSAICPPDIPSSSPKTYSLSWPIVGAARHTSHGVSDMQAPPGLPPAAFAALFAQARKARILAANHLW